MRNGDVVPAAEAINALAGFDFESRAIDAARERFCEALALGGRSAELRGRIEQNLGILAREDVYAAFLRSVGQGD